MNLRMRNEQSAPLPAHSIPNQLYAALVEQSHIGVMATDPAGTIAYANATLADLLGTTADALRGRLLADLLAGPAAIPVSLPQKPGAAHPWQGQLYFRRHHDGARVLAQVTAFRLMHSDGTAQGTGFHVQAISAEMAPPGTASATAQIDATGYENVLRAGQIGIWDWNLHSGEIYLSPVLKGFLGYADHQIRNHFDDWSRHIYPDDLPWVMEAVQACLCGETERYVVEHRMVHRDGSIRWVLTNGEVVRDAQGKALRMFGTDTDITERKRSEELLRRYEYIVSATLDSISLIDRNYTYQIVNHAYSRRSHLAPHAIVGRTVADVMGHELFETMLKNYLDRCLAGDTVHYRAWFTYINDGQRFMDVTYTPYRNANNDVEGVVVSARDITELKQAEEILQRRVFQFDALRETMNRITSELELDRLLRAILERAIDLLDASNGQIMQYNAESNDLLVLACANMQPDFSGTIQPLTEQGTGFVVRTRQPLLIPDYQTWATRLPNYARLGAHAVLLVPLLAGDQVLGIVSIGHTHPAKNFDQADSELLTLFAQQATIALKNARLFAEVQRLATTDSLTGLHNRRSFFETAQRLYDHAVRYERPLAVVMLDIDHFKQINDSFGHAIGDQVLRALASQCISTLRTVDVVGRYGGEEFVMLLPETDAEGARLVAERLRQHLLTVPVQTEHGAIAITVSLGISARIPLTRSLEQLIDLADQALYAAKQSGRNRVIVYVENPLQL